MLVKTRRPIKKLVSDYFKTLSWKEIVARLAGTNPLVFIIIKKDTGQVHQVMVKAGDNLEGLTNEDVENLLTQDMPDPDEPVKKNIDAVFAAPKIVGIEAHQSLPPKEETPENPSPVPVQDPLDHIQPVDDSLPVIKKERDTMHLQGEKTLEEGEVDLMPGMAIIWEDDAGEMTSTIQLLLEEEGQLLVNIPGTNKKKIIDVTQIKRLA